MNALDRIETRPQTLRLMALDRMRDAILEGRIAPGERLVERTLTERLGVSRSVIREVIRNLESEGLVEGTPSGPRLASLSVGQAEQIYEIRVQLESSAVAACARVATATTIRDLHAALQDIAQAHKDRNPTGALRATTRFYEIIFTTGGHDIAWEIVQRLNSRISQLRAMTLSVVGRQAAGLSRLTRIVSLIEAHEPDAAAAACREHVQEAATIACDRLRQG
ncbi:GntR family transcriptional regulator (plasmid) [Sphingomonas carotinifaciens]|uniref:DNA-binding transcriptional regulator, GntR family n=1 Tax=Sphingomonas carotinifaciens TaxID=1166323 RepID=A0A1G7MNH7_9SPHN|nr:GntR family transcriptional regulator [Sphingomonas carotinifaciens]MBB4086751.1 DNA-binding GntR family transcriptional regulator [Sphingomonas carotinifaciens]MWC42220.1 FCD domain-containing protein [Sphingomonas carotinifaciens]SDF63176.1 DNA-binding transcriptional regulator, GntR family [Sphingomonas carotinifaciens]